MRRIFATVALVGAVVAVPAGTASGVPTGADKAVLQAGVVAAGDVPSSWQGAAQKDPGTKQFKGISACKQVAALQAAAHKLPNKRSLVFQDPRDPNGVAEDVVIAYKGAAAATHTVDVYQANTTPACFQAVVQKQVGRKGQVGPLVPITSLQGVGDQSVGYEATIQGSGASQGSLVVDYVAVRVGRAFLAFVFSNSDTSLPQGPQIVNAVINRVSQASA